MLLDTTNARPSAWLTWSFDGSSAPPRPLGTFTFLGRSHLNTVPIPDPEVSLGHALIVRTAEGCLLVDLSSRNGLRVNGERVDRKLLHDGDRITIGRRTLRFRYQAAGAVSPTQPNAATAAAAGAAGVADDPSADASQPSIDPVEELVLQAAQKLASRSAEDLSRLSPSLRRARRDTVCRPLAAPTSRLDALEVA
ncbi:MAG: FHA domain-containing protein [Planctomycetes bacterium]|nr:FHA domain-containing protein [Planctomycetota bacterium]